MNQDDIREGIDQGLRQFMGMKAEDGDSVVAGLLDGVFRSSTDLDGPNLVDELYATGVRIADGARDIAHAITPRDRSPGPDCNGGNVSSLTEAVMGLTESASHIASAISDLADAVRARL